MTIDETLIDIQAKKCADAVAEVCAVLKPLPAWMRQSVLRGCLDAEMELHRETLDAGDAPPDAP